MRVDLHKGNQAGDKLVKNELKLLTRACRRTAGPTARRGAVDSALRLLCGLVLASTWSVAAASDDRVAGQTTLFSSPNGQKEACVALEHIPGGEYADADVETERAFCEVNFYDGNHALCPKVFSTSPGTLVYDISKGSFAGRPEAFEREQCATSSPVKRGAVGEPLSFKMTMNARKTSATFSVASLLYYHFSRYFDAEIHVPVSVYRSMDKAVHASRVNKPGFRLSAKRRGAAMNHAGWTVMQQALKQPSSYLATGELFTPDRQQVFGVLLHPAGDRYSAEFNGTRESGWGVGQNEDFQRTAPFTALRTDKPLLEAIDEGVDKASRNRKLHQAMRHGVSPQQMVFWMQELTEITLLDFIFSQQDRIGNIDYLNYWYWVDDGEVKRRPSSGRTVPTDIAAFQPIKLRRTQLNDNDAGGRLPYANFTKKTGMLEKIRHYSADTYRRLIALDKDLAAQGPIYQYLRDTFPLSERQRNQIVVNTGLAAGILRDSCRAGRLRFDLDPEEFFAAGKAIAQPLDCDAP
jgi:hypothetical protein